MGPLPAAPSRPLDPRVAPKVREQKELLSGAAAEAGAAPSTSPGERDATDTFLTSAGPHLRT